MGQLASLARGLWHRCEGSLLAQRGVLLYWVPVCLAIGIGGYFHLGTEPGTRAFALMAICALSGLVLARQAGEAAAPLALGCSLIAAGFLLAGARAHQVAEPVLGWRYYGPVEGRVVGMDRSQSDALRLTLDQVVLENVPPDRTPHRVRISLHGDAQDSIAPQPGLRVMTTAHLSPPSGPVEPGGFDFQRHAWFQRLGAVGYTRVPVLGAASPVRDSFALHVFRIRMAASARIQEALAGDTGGFAAAITSGDRSAISRAAVHDLRASNLAHLLAISGLHMGLLTTVVFIALRLILSLHPYTALHWPTKGVAAAGALIAASGYLALSGGNVATQRAFIMVAAALAALLLGRRALSLRTVAVAATIVLVLRPEALLGPGFQMSFAATTALVAVFGWLSRQDNSHWPGWGRVVFAWCLSSAVAGLATAPIAAAHFNIFAHYGLIANLLSVPLMGILVIPAAVAALVLYPVGLDWLGLWWVGLGLEWILTIADIIAGLEGARGTVKSPDAPVLPLIAVGFLTLLLWQGALRLAGPVAMVAGGLLWIGTDRPEVLISDRGTLVGVMTEEGRALSKARGAGFVARNWLENDGDAALQPEAAARWTEGPVLHLSGKRAAAGYDGCAGHRIVVSSVPLAAARDDPCLVLTPDDLRHTGAISVWLAPDSARIVTARGRAGDRLWSQWPRTRRGRPDQYVRINPTNRP